LPPPRLSAQRISISQAKKVAKKYFTHFLMFLLNAHENAYFFNEMAHQMPIFFEQMPAFWSNGLRDPCLFLYAKVLI
jgi:hypothetical protein